MINAMIIKVFFMTIGIGDRDKKENYIKMMCKKLLSTTIFTGVYRCILPWDFTNIVSSFIFYFLLTEKILLEREPGKCIRPLPGRTKYTCDESCNLLLLELQLNKDLRWLKSKTSSFSQPKNVFFSRLFHYLVFFKI